MSHLEKILDETFGKKKPKQVEVAVEQLHKPPMAPKPIVSETAVKHGDKDSDLPKSVKLTDTDSKLAIDFNNLDPKYQKWCISLETQRHYYYTKFGKTHREDAKGVKRDLKIKNQELDMIALMRRKKAPLYKECMKELELKLQEKRV